MNHQMHAKRPNPDSRTARPNRRYVWVSKRAEGFRGETYRRRPEGERKLTRAEKKAAKRARQDARLEALHEAMS